ncbi:hypothetical protein LTR84_003443 [Exophiala bonariae]|uniref:PRISE-like Rossmann-fold domain-containing protein n=1 Tax=Exophiala bonariae TaxID=1690606 RepID=A0AAV9N7A1_9EURO|nr:hypothetical protein LTR84_003443 [Exophiala bonariae]
MPSHKIYTNGIYHGLPTFPEHDGKQYTALVLGASGITGAYFVRVLSQSPLWKEIFAISRTAPQGPLPSHVHHVAIDLLQDPAAIAEAFKRNKIRPDYVFFAAYIQPPPISGKGLWSDEEEIERINVLLLKNLLESLEAAACRPKRIVLQTGGKHYGPHLGPPLSPMEETDPRYLRNPNFYFAQEDLLWSWCRRNGVSWNVTRPAFIVGAVPTAAMNIAYGLAVYASVQRELGGKLDYPGTVTAWDTEKHLSSATLIGYHAEWAALNDDAKDQALNIVDDSLFTYGKFWPVLAAWYGVEYGVPGETTTSVTLPASPPPRGFGPPGTIHYAWSFQDWANRPDVQEAWTRLATRHGLVKNPFEKIVDIFGILDGDVSGPWPRSMSVGKSRKLGWHGYVDSHEALYEAIEGLVNLEMVPPIPNADSQSIKYHGY